MHTAWGCQDHGVNARPVDAFFEIGRLKWDLPFFREGFATVVGAAIDGDYLDVLEFLQGLHVNLTHRACPSETNLHQLSPRQLILCSKFFV
jgi:hypothetical protein